MVWLITFLSVSNIALGYGLAWYVERHYGTLMLSRGHLKSTKPVAPATPQAVAEQPTVSPVVIAETLEAELATSEVAEPVEIGTTAAPASAAEVAASEPVDEQNVLAGIEEFRSQLAKMNASASDDPAEEFVAEAESELVGAAN